MPSYEAKLLVNTSTIETATLTMVAAQLGVRTEDLKVDRSRLGIGVVTVRFSTMRDDVVASIRSMARVQKVELVRV